jgi:hypothetical protein
MSKFNIEKVGVDDWVSLRYTISRYFYHWPEYIFRGQANDNWLLESTLSRNLKKLKIKNRQQLTGEHLDRFKLEIRGRRGDNPRQLGENELWALGQHFGLHTPLLDWTESPWVAVFFALITDEKLESGRRALWALHVPDIQTINEIYRKKYKNYKKYLVELIQPDIDENSRLVNQKGLFTKIDIDNDIEKWVTNSPKIGEWITLYKITFPDSIRQKALLYLNQMNINYSSLFPDLSGSSKNTNLKLLSSDYLAERKKMEWNGTIEDDE